MTEREIEISNQYLNKIKGGNLVSAGRAASLSWFLFVKGNEEYALHLQTAFRVVDEEGILFAGTDIFQPSEELKSNEKFDFETFEWDVQGNNRYDVNVKSFLERYGHDLVVEDILLNEYGDLTVQLNSRIKIEIFVNMSEDECWRFFKRHSDNHLVITGKGIEEEE